MGGNRFGDLGCFTACPASVKRGKVDKAEGGERL